MPPTAEEEKQLKEEMCGLNGAEVCWKVGTDGKVREVLVPGHENQKGVERLKTSFWGAFIGHRTCKGQPVQYCLWFRIEVRCDVHIP
jgi:hypothetical protein